MLSFFFVMGPVAAVDAAVLALVHKSQVRQDAKDTCTNWFYKIGAIPDLLSRIYLEVAIVRCMCFLQDEPPVQTFERLTMMMRGLSGAYLSVCSSRAPRSPRYTSATHEHRWRRV